MISRRLLALSLLAPLMVSAQQFGTKKDVLATTPGGGSSVFPLLQMLLALGIVFALLKFALPKVASKLNKRLVTSVNSSIRIEESANFAGGSLYIVGVRDRSLLLSVGTNGVQLVSDLTPAAKAPEPPLFSEMLETAVVQDPYVPSTPVVEEPNPVVVREALDRLARLTG